MPRTTLCVPTPSCTFAAQVVHRLLFAASGTLALWTVLYQIALWQAWSYATLCFSFWYVSAPLALLLFVFVRPERNNNTPFAAFELIPLIGCAILASLLALWANRPDADDVYYLSRSVFYWEHPNSSIDLLYHHALSLDGESFNFSLLRLYSLELFWGSLSWLLPIHPATTYFVVGCAAHAALIPLVWYLALSRFSSRHSSVLLGSLIICAYLLLDGYARNSVGNFAFVRIWQTKAVLVSIALPLCLAWSIDFFRSPSQKTALPLFLLVVSSLGLGATTIVLLPAFAVTMVGGYLATTGISRDGLRTTCGYAALFTPIPLAALAAYLGLDSSYRTSFNAHEHKSFGTLFRGIFYGVESFPAITLIGSISLALALARPPTRRFLAGWILVAAVLFLNPLVHPFIIHHIGIYWRLFFILPFPFTVGLIAARVADRIPDKLIGPLSATGIGITLCLAALFIPNDCNVLRRKNSWVQRNFAHYKLKPLILDATNEILQQAPKGGMLAPPKFSLVVPMLSSEFPQLVIKSRYLQYRGRSSESIQIAAEVLRAREFIAGTSDEGLESFSAILGRSDIHSVVLTRDLNTALGQLALAALLQNGFTERHRGVALHYELFTRQSAK